MATNPVKSVSSATVSPLATTTSTTKVVGPTAGIDLSALVGPLASGTTNEGSSGIASAGKVSADVLAALQNALAGKGAGSSSSASGDVDVVVDVPPITGETLQATLEALRNGTAGSDSADGSTGPGAFPGPASILEGLGWALKNQSDDAADQAWGSKLKPTFPDGFFAGLREGQVDSAAETTMAAAFESSMPVDINAFVQWVLRESYLETTEDLYYYAEKVQFYNDLKKSMRDELTRARDILAEYAGADDDAAIDPPVDKASFDATYTGADAESATATQAFGKLAATPGALAGQILKTPGVGKVAAAPGSAKGESSSESGGEFQADPTNHQPYAFQYAQWLANGGAPNKEESSSESGGEFQYDPTNPSPYAIQHSLWIANGGTSGSTDGEGYNEPRSFGDKKFIGNDEDEDGRVLAENTGAEIAQSTVEEITEYYNSLTPAQQEAFLKQLYEEGIDIDVTQVEDDAVYDDEYEAGSTYKPQEGASFEEAMAGLYEAIVDNVDDAVGDASKEDGYGEAEYGDLSVDVKVPGFSYDAAASETEAAESAESASSSSGSSGSSDTASTKAELEAYIESLEEQVNTVGDDAQLANVDLQNMLQKQQQTLQMLSNISKTLYDTAMSIVRNMNA